MNRNRCVTIGPRSVGQLLEVMHAIQQAGADGGTIKIILHIERPASLSDKEASSHRRSAAT